MCGVALALRVGGEGLQHPEAKCGNGIVEAGEACDSAAALVGGVQDTCCDTATCQLKAGCVCATSVCSSTNSTPLTSTIPREAMARRGCSL